MIRHYFIVTWRDVLRAPVVAAINVVTLGVGLWCFLVTHAFVSFWNNAERAYPAADRAFVLTMSVAAKNGSFARRDVTLTPERAAETLRADFPDVERVARAIPIEGNTSVSSGDRAVNVSAVAVDPEFLEIFELPFTQGDRRKALVAPNSAVLTREAAAQIFGTANPVGEYVLIGNTVQAAVTGVIAEIPQPSHIGRATTAPVRVDMLVSVDVQQTLRANLVGQQFADFRRQSWKNGSALTYLLLPIGGRTADSLRKQFPDFVSRHISAVELQSDDVSFDLLPVREVLRQSIDDELFSRDIGMSVSKMLWLLGLVVLLVACVNYANLATARAVRRIREIGVRKALGARPSQVARQHLFEAALHTMVALAVAVSILGLSLPALERASSSSLRSAFFSPALLGFLVLLVVTVTLAAGSYPAIVASRVKPVKALGDAAASFGAKRLAIVLVAVQFAAGSLLLIAVLITRLQNAELVRSGLDTSSSSVVMLENPTRMTKVDSATLRDELQRIPEIEAVTEMASLPWQRLVPITFISREPAPGGRRVLVRDVGYDFFSAMNIDVLAGRVFSRERGDDASFSPPAPDSPIKAAPVLVDSAFVTEFGFGTAGEAVGQIVYFPLQQVGIGTAVRFVPLEVVGVVESRRLTFRGAGAESAIYRLNRNLEVTVARIAAGQYEQALTAIDATWKRLAPTVAIRRSFFDEHFSRAYATFLRLSQILTALAIAALIIATVGLFGIATLVASGRVREIGVRKAVGASTTSIVRSLLISFCWPALVANLAVWPIAYYAARAYLAAFVDPIALTLGPFFMSLVFTAVVGCLAVGAQTLRAARSAPADVLRYE